jgi:hypothetical protein
MKENIKRKLGFVIYYGVIIIMLAMMIYSTLKQIEK